MGDGFLAVQVQKPRAHGLMKVMQLQRTHVITSIISNMRNVFTKECKGKTHKFRRRDADGCDRDGRAPEKSCQGSRCSQFNLDDLLFTSWNYVKVAYSLSDRKMTCAALLDI